MLNRPAGCVLHLASLAAAPGFGEASQRYPSWKFLQGTILEMWRQGDFALQDYASPEGIQMPQIYGVLEVSFQRNREQPTWTCITGAKKVPPRSSLLQGFFPSHFLGSGFVFFGTLLQMWFKGAARGKPFFWLGAPHILRHLPV